MNTQPIARGRSLRLAAVIAVAALCMVAPGSVAQTPESEGATTGEAHPAHIHSGSCAELGDVVFPLDDVMIPADAEHEGSEAAHPVKSSH